MAVASLSSYQASQQSNVVIQERLPTILELEKLTQNFIARNKLVYEYLVTDNDARGKDFAQLTEESQVLEQRILENHGNDSSCASCN